MIVLGGDETGKLSKLLRIGDHMRRTAIVFFLIVVLLCASCAVKNRKYRLDEDDDVIGLTGPEVQSDLQALTERVNGLWTELSDQKLTAYSTKQKISNYFENEKDLTEFIAIYASIFRDLDFHREIVKSYKVKSIKIEPNGVLALVEISIKGTIYFVWQGRLREVQKWQKSEGKWYIKPQAY